MTREQLRGIFPPIPTTFDSATGEVDDRAITGNVKKWMSTGLAGVLALGSNGEAPYLDDAEGDRVVAAARDGVPADRVLLVGTGRESTRATVAATKRAADLGADAVLVRAPSYYRAQMTPEALVAHYRAIADASPVPVLLYNLPGVTGFSLTLATVAALAEHPNIVGMKETSSDLERLGQFAAIDGGRFVVLCGWAPVVYPALVSGAAGAILAVANVVPSECVALQRHVQAGRHDDALRLQQRLTPLAQQVTSVHGIAGLKIALEIVGYAGGPVRAPLRAASPAAHEDIARALRAVQP
jgi:4-hydroxy-2-oxoglutarate aldolase